LEEFMDPLRPSPARLPLTRRVPLLLLPVFLLQCDYATPGDHRLTSLRLTLQSPKAGELGTPAAPQRIDSLHFDVEALDEKGQLMPQSPMLSSFLAAGGSRLSLVNPCAAAPPGGDPGWLLQRFALSAGRATNVVADLTSPVIFGRVELNLEDPVSQALGSSPPIYFPNPTISHLVTPLDPSASNASYCSPFLGRQVVIDHASHPSGAGKLVVSSLFQTGIGVSDSSAPEYGSLYVFTFSQPSSALRLGTVISRMSGSIAKFNGMTQLANPAIAATSELQPDLIPQPVTLDSSRLPDNKATDQVNNKWLTKYIAAPARITGTICEVQNDPSRRDNWLKYNTVVINLIDSDPASTDGCTPGQDFSFRYFSVQMPGKGFAGFDPLKLAGTEASFVGMLMNSASKSGKTLYWTVAVRSASDVCLTPRTGC
jgi:hypothetical protein